MNLDDCHYATLGLSSKASHDEVVTAVKKARLSVHPNNTNDTFAEEARQQAAKVHDAYDVLKRPESRERYDRSLGHSQNNQ